MHRFRAGTLQRLGSRSASLIPWRDRSTETKSGKGLVFTDRGRGKRHDHPSLPNLIQRNDARTICPHLEAMELLKGAVP
jgi:hypothetical protein